MKRFPFVAAAVVLTVVLMSCPQPFTPSRSGGDGPTSFQLPADGITDTPRASGGAFTFETLFPVELALDVTLYGRDEDGNLADEPLDPALHTVNVSLTNSRGNAVYTGRLRPDGSLATIVYLASAPEDMTLTLSSAGFDSRTITIERMVEFSRIERAMAIAQAAPGSRAASTIEFGDPDYQLNIPADGVLTIAFEDLFGRARAGDADYNDFIAEYRITETIDGETGGIVSIRVDAEAMVKLAGYNHAFGIRIDSFAGDATVTGEFIDGSGAVARLEDMPEFASLISAPAEIVLFERSGRALGKKAWFELEFAVGQSRQEESEKNQAPSKQPELSAPPYNPYIFVHNTQKDIHLIGREALTNSNNPGDPFIDSDGFPWALLVPRDWEHPEEAQRIEVKYPRFTNWRESGGDEHQDWYDWLYEPYVPPEFLSVRYEGNGHSSGTAPVDDAEYEEGDEVTVLGNSGDLRRAGFGFTGWNTAPDGSGESRAVGSTFTMPGADVTLYAQWKGDYAVGDEGPAGGWIFYDHESLHEDGWRYLEAAPGDISENGEQTFAWSNVTSALVGTSPAIGAGAANTLAIVAQDGHETSAAQRTVEYATASLGSGFDDWFLPSRDELREMYFELHTESTGDFTESGYLSSTEQDASFVDLRRFDTGEAPSSFKGTSERVRPVRAF